MIRFPFRSLASCALASLILVPLLVVAPALAEDASVIPLPAEFTKELALLGEGVVGKALPAPVLTDPQEFLNLGSGEWVYEIVAGGKDGKKVRTERYEKAPSKDGEEVWKRTIGSEFVEYLRFEKGKDFGKHLEDDLELGYTSRFLPGVVWLGHPKPGASRTIESKVEAFKTDKPGTISYRGTMKATLSYVGQYEVKTPAGTFPAILIVNEFDIEIGPAKVTDTTYTFYAKGVGKVAEVEGTRISALLIYHSNTDVAKILSKYPKR